ncbi:alpha-keto acid decarboxylase family protein [Promicromonospora iranensis]|uniref:Alpha-keto-acid decarboxylase n=1 Tax=Promicromonospora iranensis TaxID=1105144 RepID=A0ABU2CIR5_9MICO|nr:thiamine pyrophosphate-binding protein [Promicromonospora iranensis]MDR7381208.1 indolepyruvate decarboxylase [Promicromonospora iranensis]
MTEDHRTVTVGKYLALRLQELGTNHLFGLPGDFNLALLDEMLDGTGLEWVGSTNELNAAYAADGYARMRRSVAALVTTYGVGELSAINGIAGSYAEDVPVVQITGAPSTQASSDGALLHHTLVDGDHGHFERAYREVTAHTEVLRAESAVQQIDRALMTAVRESKPVYISVPADVAVAAADGGNLSRPLPSPRSDPAMLEDFRSALKERLSATASVTVLAGPRLHRRGLEREVQLLAESPGVRIASQPGSKAILDEEHRRSLGTYMGQITRSSAARATVDTAEPIVLAGVVLSDVLTGLFSHRFDVADAIALDVVDARIGGSRFYGVLLEDSVQALRDVVTELDLDDQLVDPVRLGVAPAALDEQPLTQAQFWTAIQRWLPSGTTVIADAGTAFYGALELAMPPGCDLLGQPIWSSIGYTLPATLGACLAQPDKRVSLFIGDGSAQLTIQELATVLHRGLAPVMFLINNAGYTVERAIRSPDAPYQDVTSWDWLALPGALGAPDAAITIRASTGAELTAALALATSRTDVLVLIEVIMDRLDTPTILTELTAGLAAASPAPSHATTSRSTQKPPEEPHVTDH